MRYLSSSTDTISLGGKPRCLNWSHIKVALNRYHARMDRWPVAVGIGMSTLTVVLIVIVLFLD
jgi:hypothetical protein